MSPTATTLLPRTIPDESAPAIRGDVGDVEPEVEVLRLGERRRILRERRVWLRRVVCEDALG